jgi:hypothetical protein
VLLAVARCSTEAKAQQDAAAAQSATQAFPSLKSQLQQGSSQLSQLQSQLSQAQVQYRVLQARLQGRSSAAGRGASSSAAASSGPSLLSSLFAFKQPPAAAPTAAVQAGNRSVLPDPAHQQLSSMRSLTKALSVIGGSSLGVVVMGSARDASRLLADPAAVAAVCQGGPGGPRQGGQLRIWPLDSLQMSDRTEAQRAAQRELGAGEGRQGCELADVHACLASQPCADPALTTQTWHLTHSEAAPRSVRPVLPLFFTTLARASPHLLLCYSMQTASPYPWTSSPMTPSTTPPCCVPLVAV